MATTAKQRAAQNHGALRENKANGHPAVFDLDAYQAEAVREPFAFTLGGQTFEIPHMSDMDWHASFDEDGNLSMATGHQMLRQALGDQWQAFNKIPLKAAAYNELQRRWHQHSGIDLGEDSASPPS